MALIRCPECNELTVRGQPVEWSSLWEYECHNGHVWQADPDESRDTQADGSGSGGSVEP